MSKDTFLIRKIYDLMFGLIIIAVFTSIMLISYGIDASAYKKQLRNMEGGWFTVKNQDFSIDDVRVKDFGGSVLLSHDLPNNITENDCLNFESTNVDLIVFVEGKQIYSFTAKENLTGRGYGSAFHQVGLDPEDGNKAISIFYKAVLPEYKNGCIQNVYLGPSNEYVEKLMLGKVFNTFISGLIIFFGLVMVLMYFWITDKTHLPYDITALGLTAIVLGTWLFIDTNVLHLLFGHIYLWRGISRIVIAFLGYPLVAFINSLTKTRRTIYLRIAFWSNVVFLASVIGFRYLSGSDMIRYFDFALISYYSCLVILILVLLVENFIYCRANNLSIGLNNLYIGLILYMGCAGVDVVLSFFNIRSGDDYGTFTRIGTVTFIILLLMQFISWWNGDQYDIERERFINKALHYSIASASPEKSIMSMLEYVGSKLGAKRVLVFEQQDSGKYHGTYEWFEEGHLSGSIDLIYLPYDGFIDRIHKACEDNDHKIIVNNVDDIKHAYPELYNLMTANNAHNLVGGALEINRKLHGIIAIIDTPKDQLRQATEIISLIAYFVTQLMMRRDEQARLRFYSYNDQLSGVYNRRAYMEYINGGLNTANPFGFMLCELSGIHEINEAEGYEAGDNMLVSAAECLTEVFGKENIYRISGTDFAVFGFETEESVFYNDVMRLKKLANYRGLSILVGALYCANGTMDIKIVIRRASELLARDRATFFPKKATKQTVDNKPS